MFLKKMSIPLCLGFFIALLVLYYGGPSSGDDTFIYMRYVQNAMEHGQFTYNIGERSHGVTSSIWPMIMLFISMGWDNSLIVWKLASVIFTGAGIVFFYLAIRSHQPHNMGKTVLFTLIIAFEPHNFRWNSSGMENALAFFILAVITFSGQIVRSRSTDHPLSSKWLWGFPIIIGILPFVRPELAILSVGLICYLLGYCRNRYEYFYAGLSYLLTVTLLSFLTFMIFGSVIPQTAEAKAYLLKQTDSWYGFIHAMMIIGSGSLGALLILLFTPPKSRSIKIWRYITFMNLIICLAYLTGVNQIVSSRYASYLTLPTVIAAVLILSECSRLTNWLKICIGIQLMVSIYSLVIVFPVTRVSEDAQIKHVAEFVVSATPQNARVAIAEIGVFGFYSQRYIIDLLGLTDRATLIWKQQHGRPENIDAFEKLLIARGATHYVDTSAGEQPLQGKTLTFYPLREFSITRNIFERGRAIKSLWRVYALQPQS